MKDYSKFERSYEEIAIGETADIKKTITEEDVFKFASIIDDCNPVHLDAEYAQSTMFGGRIDHGMHTASFFTALIATRLIGIRAIYISQEIKFLKPVRIGDTIDVRAVVTGKNDEKCRVNIKTTVYNQHGEIVVDGNAVIAVLKQDIKQ